MAIPGICGPANRPCKISHVSTYPNQVGVYPSEFLPSTFTIWHAVFASQFPLQAQPDSNPLLDLNFVPNLAPISPLAHTFQSHHYVIFARTENHLNKAYVLTETDIDNMDGAGVSEIDIGEFVFEVVAATDEPMDPNTELTEQEIADLETTQDCFVHEGCSSESQSDREFRKLFEIPIRNEAGINLINRFLGIVPNVQGVEYRLDNGTAKSRKGLDQAGLGDLDNPSYRDGSSRKIRVQIGLFAEDGSVGDGTLVAGEPIFLTYVAVKEHYVRQRIVISWQVFDDPGRECITIPLGHSIAHYRFYEWDMEPESNADLTVPVKLSGWRAVETFSSDINFVAPIFDAQQSTVIADFVIGGPDLGGSTDFPIIPGIASLSTLQSIIDDRNLETPISIDLDKKTLENQAYHENVDTNNVNTAYRQTPWFLRNQFSKYRGRIEASAHVFFNVHPLALRKRDVDKFGIERFLAVELEKDYSQGIRTFFPFMDNPEIDNPTLGVGVNDGGLSSSNCLFQPIKPVSSYGGNFEAVCASIGSFPTNPGLGLNSYHSFESNRITEKFDTDTRVLVERNFAVNGDIISPRFITIEGAGGGSRGAVSCISDPSKEFQFASHTNSDGFLVFNSFSSGYTAEAIRSLSFRPDVASPPFKENLDPTVDQFERLIGFGSMIGDIPGIQPGRAVGLASFADPASFEFKTTARDTLPSFVEDTQIDDIVLPSVGASPLVILVTNTYYGSITIKYRIGEDASEKNAYAILLAKVDNIIVGSVDSLTIQTVRSGNVAILQADFRWLRASSFELIGERVEDMDIISITLRGINTDKLHDFLFEETSHTAQFAQQSIDDRATDRSLFFSANTISMSEDENSNLYIFFNDTDGGISVVATNDDGGSWHYHYGIVEKIGDREAVDPFVVTHTVSNGAFLFYRFGGKVLCKKISYSLFVFRDANLIERFSSDVFEAEGTITDEVNQTSFLGPVEGDSIYTTEGKLLRRSVISNIAAGDLTDESFLELIGKVPGEFEYVANEQRQVDGKLIPVRKNPIATGPGTAFVNVDIIDPFFSAYRRDNGELRLWYLSATEDSPTAGQLQCNFSVDDGQTWFDLWEFIANSYRRLRMDIEKNTQFIDRTASGTDVPTNLEGADPQESNQLAQFGINIHWSRLSRHKTTEGEGELTVNSESEVLEVSSPYVFYQSTTDRVFLFYVYQGCLLCKVFNDSIFSEAARIRDMDRVKDVIERQVRAHFIDGSLSSSELREELHGFANEDTQETMANGNIIFKYPFAVDNFTDDRTIVGQRVCAVDLPTGLVRVFYKHADSINLKSALWIGSEWWAEDFLRTSSKLTEFTPPDSSEFTNVTGGFGGTGFSP